MALKDIINNAKYGDDIVLTLPDGTTGTIGEMRSLSAEDRQSLVQRQNMVEQAEIAIAAKVREFQNAGLLPTDGKPRNNPTDRDIRAAASAEFGLDEKDPLLGPIVAEFKKELSKRDEAMTSMKGDFTKAIETITGVVQTAVGANLEERYQTDFERATKDLPKGVSVKYEDAFKRASDLGLKDKWGRLDLHAAVDRMTWDDRKKAEKESLREEISRDLERKSALAGATRPRTAGPENHRPKTAFDPFEHVKDPRTGQERTRVKSFDEALAAATADEDLMASAMAAASFGPVQ